MRGYLAILVAAGVIAASPAAAQNFEAVLEVERYVNGGNDMLARHRQQTQRNIDLATKALQAKDYPRAVKYARAVARQDPKRIEAWLMLGAAQQGIQDWKGARKSYTTAVRLSPKHPEARAGLGIAYARTADPRATVQLAWLTEQAQACGGRCPQAAELTALKRDVEAALVPARDQGG